MKWYDILGRAFHFVGPVFASFIVEFIGTFFLVLTIGFNVVAKNPFAPIAIGSTLMVMIFMGGHISGAHYNPAVTLGVRLTGRDHISTSLALGYTFVQLCGSTLAPLIVWGVTGQTFAPSPGEGISQFKAFVVEFFYTFALVSVMLNTATTKSQSSNSFFGLAIGFTVLSGAYSVGSISGGAFNPAVGTGPTIIHAALGHTTFKYIWIYWLGPCIGAVLAAVIFRVTNPREYRKTTAIASTIKDPKGGYQPVQDTDREEPI